MTLILNSITKTRLYNFDPLTSHIYILKLGFTGVYIIFLISTQNIDCGYSLEPPRWGGSNEYPQSMLWDEIWKISDFFIWNFSFFGGKIFTIFELACFRNALLFFGLCHVSIMTCFPFLWLSVGGYNLWMWLFTDLVFTFFGVVYISCIQWLLCKMRVAHWPTYRLQLKCEILRRHKKEHMRAIKAMVNLHMVNLHVFTFPYTIIGDCKMHW